jgi:hypothetical protein
MTQRYTLSSAIRAIKKPKLIIGEGRRIAMKMNRKFTSYTSCESTNIMKLDWDVLVILDGCRLDLFSEESSLEGKTSSVESAGSESREFMHSYFQGESYHDTVYVTANPHTSKLESGIFHDIKKIYNTHWDSELETVRPESVTSVVKETDDMYPEKRLIIHYMQPHFPFIGETGQKIDRDNLGSDGDIWTPLRFGRLSVNEEMVWEAYAENYRLVENEVSEIHSSIAGKTVVTSDHGNLVGERLAPIPVKWYGHTPGIRHHYLNTVPWHEMPISERRQTSADSPKDIELRNQAAVKSQLEALGYS